MTGKCAVILSSLARPLCTADQDTHSLIVKPVAHPAPELRRAQSHYRTARPSPRGLGFPSFNWDMGRERSMLGKLPPGQSLGLGDPPPVLSYFSVSPTHDPAQLYLVGRCSGRWQVGPGRCCLGGRAGTGTRCDRPHSGSPCNQAGRGS